MSYGPGTDPIPYIAASYALGFLIVVGGMIQVILERRKLRASLALLSTPKPKGAKS
jgi:hypothetical protein